jgi:hypothetical protein
MTSTTKIRRSPVPKAAPARPRRHWPAAASAVIAFALISAVALSGLAALPAPSPAATAPTVGPAPAPTIGAPFLANLGRTEIARVTVVSASFTAPGRLVLDTRWDAYSGSPMSDPNYFEVRNADGGRVSFTPLQEGQLEAGPVTPSTPRKGLVAYDITGPATLILHPTTQAEPTRITINP